MKARTRLFSLLLLAAPFLASCVPPPRELVAGPGDVGDGQVIVVGKIKLTPPLHKGEQSLNIIGSEEFKNRFLLFTGDQWRQLETPLVADDYKGRIEAPLDRTFFAAGDPNPFYILGGGVAIEFVGSQPNYAYYPGGYRVNIRTGDQAVYIGTLHYYRDEFSNTLKIVLEDEYDEAQVLFARNFGPRLHLRKALLTQVQQVK